MYIAMLLVPWMTNPKYLSKCSPVAMRWLYQRSKIAFIKFHKNSTHTNTNEITYIGALVAFWTFDYGVGIQ